MTIEMKSNMEMEIKIRMNMKSEIEIEIRMKLEISNNNEDKSENQMSNEIKWGIIESTNNKMIIMITVTMEIK